MLEKQKRIFGFLISAIFVLTTLVTQAQQNIHNIKVVVTFDAAPSTYEVVKAPLKYNKDFALSFQVDDGTVDIATKVIPQFDYFKYTDGCGNDIPFTASSSVYVFQGTSNNGPDMHDPSDPSFDPAYLSWDEIKILYNKNYGIYNHGINTAATTTNDFMNYSIGRNRSYIRRKMYSYLNGAISSKAFVCPNQLKEWRQPAIDYGYSIAMNKEDNGPIGLNGGNVNLADWTQPQQIKRREAHRVVPVPEYVDNLANQSIDGANYWGSIFTHQITDTDDGVNHYPKDIFNSDFSYIAQKYGKDGADNIIIASDEEIYDYLNLRDAVNLNVVNIGNTLEITFGGDIPDDFRFYAMSLVVTADQAISKIEVTGAENFSVNPASGLVNFSWNDRVIPNPTDIADSFVTIAENSGTQFDAWIAMDYVWPVPLSNQKADMVSRLCALPGLSFDNGFCDITVDTIVYISTSDSILCQGDTTKLTATPGMKYYTWSTGETTSSITVTPSQTTKYYVDATNSNNTVTSDTILITVNPIPNIVSHSKTPINHVVGENDTLWVSTQDINYTYLWNTGDTDSSLIVDPIFTSNYYVDIFNQYECSDRQEFEVIVNKTFDFIYDSVCFGDTTHLINNSTYPDSVILVAWDLNSDGVFDDAVGDTVNFKFVEPGNHLVGMRSTLYPSGIKVAFNVVPVGDKPVPDFLVSNNCIPDATQFQDISTVLVGDNIEFNWDFNDNGATDVGAFVTHTFFNPGTYDIKLKVVSSIGCSDSIIKQTEIGEAVDFIMIDGDGNELFANDTSWVSTNDSLYVSIQNPTSYDSIIWDGNVRNNFYYVNNEGSFNVDVFTGSCSKSRTRYMFFTGGGGSTPPSTDNIINLFTPNGDGYNDNWVVNDPNITTPFSVSIYNRYGRLVYESTNYQNDWNGIYDNTNLPQATYYYIIKDANGNIYKGPVTIIR